MNLLFSIGPNTMLYLEIIRLKGFTNEELYD